MILPVINIGTGYQIGLMWSSPLTQGIKIGLLGYGGLLRLSQDRMPIVFYDRPAIQAEAILQQGMHLNVFSQVYCDRVYFSCAERNMTGSGFDPPPPSGTPYPVEKSSAPPPPPGVVIDDIFFLHLGSLEVNCWLFHDYTRYFHFQK